ncbi:hypothetical protein EYC98_21300 [Halieaceae bacterium IMCC14734]|uniref:Uncharacterized protein n=1 Tax=Candidatus Litorirhabdus singularis TaxID=2518993 RepID=A0ABT3TN10_9GAMM|nr:hypothetical protein [Candidatus Litorirhabdus singularis]MCX2983404.1 hypothetical protein [Candidatus Litorirhabdus singularis]
MTVSRGFAGLIIGSIFLLNSAVLAVGSPAGAVKILKVPKATHGSFRSRIGTAPLSAIRLSDLPVNNARVNISQLLKVAVKEERVNEIESMEYLKRFHEVSERGDAVLLECLRHAGCDVSAYAKSPALKPASSNQLHLMHLARCPECNFENLAKRSGDTAESIMASFYSRGGWIKIKGEVGVTGIDGLFVKFRGDGAISEVLVVESKYNTSQLAHTSRSGMQMSPEWIEAKVRNLITFSETQGTPADIRNYEQVLEHIKGKNYRAQLWKVLVDGDRINVDRYKVLAKGEGLEIQNLDMEDATRDLGLASYTVDIFQPKTKMDTMFSKAFWSSLGEGNSAVR